MTPPRPFAVFDIDGTIYRHDLTLAISQEMQRRRLVPGLDCGGIEAAEKAWRLQSG